MSTMLKSDSGIDLLMEEPAEMLDLQQPVTLFDDENDAELEQLVREGDMESIKHKLEEKLAAEIAEMEEKFADEEKQRDEAFQNEEEEWRKNEEQLNLDIHQYTQQAKISQRSLAKNQRKIAMEILKQNEQLTEKIKAEDERKLTLVKKLAPAQECASVLQQKLSKLNNDSQLYQKKVEGLTESFSEISATIHAVTKTRDELTMEGTQKCTQLKKEIDGIRRRTKSKRDRVDAELKMLELKEKDGKNTLQRLEKEIEGYKEIIESLNSV